MANFTVEVKGIRDTIRKFDRYADQAEDAVWAGIQRTAFEAVDVARFSVRKDTSTLARSIQVTDEDRQGLSMTVSTNTEYAAVIEFGFSGVQQVQAHQRTITQAFGRPVAAQTVQVVTHQRYVNRAPSPYMEPAARVAQANIGDHIKAELEALEL